MWDVWDVGMIRGTSRLRPGLLCYLAPQARRPSLLGWHCPAFRGNQMGHLGLGLSVTGFSDLGNFPGRGCGFSSKRGSSGRGAALLRPWDVVLRVCCEL